MKRVLFALMLPVLSYAQSGPDFRLIFNQIASTNSVSESIAIRERYLPQMRNMQDFARLTDMEKLRPGEHYFPNYRGALAEFVYYNVNNFINPDRKNELGLFLSNIFPKVRDGRFAYGVAEMGLAYVGDCASFKDYVRSTHSSLSSNYGRQYCYRTEQGRDYQLRSVLFHPRTIEAGRWDSINFNDYLYVKKIYISAEGLRGDAYFDIMVNGEIKGTIYAPGRDPSYVVTVEDYADSILIRSLSGDAKITTVLLETK